MKHLRFLRGAAAVSLGAVVSKGIGAVYRIALSALLPALGMGLYQMAWPFFCLFLTLTSAGAGYALSRTVARERALGRSGRSALLAGLRLFALLGGVGGALLFVFAPGLRRVAGGFSCACIPHPRACGRVGRRALRAARLLPGRAADGDFRPLRSVRNADKSGPRSLSRPLLPWGGARLRPCGAWSRRAERGRGAFVSCPLFARGAQSARPHAAAERFLSSSRRAARDGVRLHPAPFAGFGQRAPAPPVGRRRGSRAFVRTAHGRSLRACRPARFGGAGACGCRRSLACGALRAGRGAGGEKTRALRARGGAPCRTALRAVPLFLCGAHRSRALSRPCGRGTRAPYLPHPRDGVHVARRCGDGHPRLLPHGAGEGEPRRLRYAARRRAESCLAGRIGAAHGGHGRGDRAQRLLLGCFFS